MEFYAGVGTPHKNNINFDVAFILERIKNCRIIFDF